MKTKVRKVRQVEVEDEIIATEWADGNGFDLQYAFLGFPGVIPLSYDEWESIKKAIKALRKGKSNRVKEEPETSDPTEQGASEMAESPKKKKKDREEC